MKKIKVFFIIVLKMIIVIIIIFSPENMLMFKIFFLFRNGFDYNIQYMYR